MAHFLYRNIVHIGMYDYIMYIIFSHTFLYTFICTHTFFFRALYIAFENVIFHKVQTSLRFITKDLWLMKSHPITKKKVSTYTVDVLN